MAITFYNTVTNRWIGCILKIYLQINCLDVKMYFQCYKEIRFHSIAKYPFHKCSKRTIAEEIVTTDMNHFPIGLVNQIPLGLKKQTFRIAEILRTSGDKNVTT